MAAFTLVEVLVVFAILAILWALCIPSYRSFIERSQGAACANNMRQLAVALNLFRGEHNGWFPPGYPAAPSKIDAQDAQPGMPPQPGTIDFSDWLVPNYIAALPLCPGLHLTSDGRKKYPDEQKRLQQLGGSYGINSILLQWKVEAMPWPGWLASRAYSASKMPFLLETGAGSRTWAFTHQWQALNGITTYQTMGRSHGPGGILNFMFLDGHMEAISRNDPRDVSEDQKTWLYPNNPNGRFEAWGQNGRFIPHTQLNIDQFKAIYPSYYPPSN